MQKLGDVLFAKRLVMFSVDDKIYEDGHLMPRTAVPDAGRELIDRFNNAAHFWQPTISPVPEWYPDNTPTGNKRTKYQLHTGVMVATGEHKQAHQGSVFQSVLPCQPGPCSPRLFLSSSITG